MQALDRGVLVQYAVDFDFDDGEARNRGQKHPSQGVAQRVAETAFQRFQRDTRAIRVDGIYTYRLGFQHVFNSTHHGELPQKK